MGILYVRKMGNNAEYKVIARTEDFMSIPEDVFPAREYFPEEDYHGWYYLDSIREKQPGPPPEAAFLEECGMLSADSVSTEYFRYMAYDDEKGNIMYQTVRRRDRLKAQKAVCFYPDGERTVISLPLAILGEQAPDAVYIRKCDCLYFKDLRKICRMFPWLSDVYKERSLRLIRDFMEMGLVHFTRFMNEHKIGRANIRRLLRAKDIYDGFSEEDRSKLDEYIKVSFNEIYYDAKAHSFAVDSDKEMKRILYCIEQKCYITAVTNEKRIAQNTFNA